MRRAPALTLALACMGWLAGASALAVCRPAQLGMEVALRDLVTA